MTAQPRIRSTTKHATDAGIAAASLEVLPPLTLLFAMYASLGTTAVLDTPAVTNQAILGLTPRAETEREFLRYWLEALGPSLHAYSRSNTQDNLNAEVFGNLPFPGLPLPAQQRIAGFLDRETSCKVP
jgi:type I restriction enzyme S subunit